MRFVLAHRGLAAAVLVGAALAAPGTARAAFVADSIVNITSTSPTQGPGYFTGSVAVDNLTTTSASIQIKLTNTSPVANGGYLTSFAFNLPGAVKGATLTATYAPNTAQSFNLIGGVTTATPKGDFSNDISTGPLGNFDVGAAVGPDWHSSGTAANGLTPGETGTFTFTITGTGFNANLLTAQALMTYMSQSVNGSAVGAIGVRFRDFKDGSGDKVFAGVLDTPTPNNPVPAPPAAVMLGLGGLCLLGRKVRRRAKA
jgi:hypothetical protein